MRKYIAIFYFLFSAISYSQVGIGNTDPHPSALLDIRDSNGNTRGILIPKVDLTADLTSITPIEVTPDDGLLVYNIGTNIEKGFYFWRNGRWNEISTNKNLNNFYSADGSLTGQRTVAQGSNFVRFSGTAGRNAFTLKRTQNTLDEGIGFQNSDGTYDAGIYMPANKQAGLIFSTGGSDTNISSITPTLTLNDDNSIKLNQYGGTKFKSTNPPFFLTLENNGNITQLASPTAYTYGNLDWFEEGTTRAPNNINDNIYTIGEVGINTNAPNAPLHITETMGTEASATDGTIILEHGNAGGESSIIFKSAANSGSDYGYIKYQDDGSGNGSGNDNGLLTLGVENDAIDQWADDINISSTGSVGINTTAPSPSSSLDLGDTDKGLLINKVALQSLTDDTTIGGNEPNGLLVYNTNATPGDLEEGFYFWQIDRWHLLKVDTPEGATPDSAVSNGVQFYSYNFSEINKAPDLGDVATSIVVVKSGGYTSTLDSAAIATMRPDNTDPYIIKMVGTYTVPVAGTYNFTTTSSDGVRIYIDHSIVLNEWEIGAGLTGSGTVQLNEGKHQFEFWYFDSNNQENFSFSMEATVIKASDFTVE